MRRLRTKAVLLAAMAVILVSGYIGAAYACFTMPYYGIYSWGQTDLKIKDQDEPWKDGVFGTWTADNMAPGDEFTFTGSFVGLKGTSTRMYSVGTVDISCGYNPWKPGQPDAMAKYMVVTRCVYTYSYLYQQWRIDFLTGRLTSVSGPGGAIPPNPAWKIQDMDGDGRITFFDLKIKPLRGVPSFTNNESRFEMSVSFSQDAGDKFQDCTFNLTMFYTLVSW
jgi:hypothetical protein